jgi:Zn-dependent protease with chaperone function
MKHSFASETVVAATEEGLPLNHGLNRRFMLRSGCAWCVALSGLAGSGAALAREGVEVGKTSRLAKLVPAEQLEQAAAQQYQKLLQEAAAKNALLPANHAQTVRLRMIGTKILPFTYEWNPRAKDWKWEVNILNSKQINAFCMPGGKIAFYTGILDQLQLTDDEVAMIMGHEVAHALREHARERMGKSAATSIGANVIGAVLGVGNTGSQLLGMGAQLMTLKFGREDESEADLVGMELAARAAYNPRAGVSLWQKMGEASKGAPPQFLSTHPSGPTRIKDIEANLPKVEPLFVKAGGKLNAPYTNAASKPAASTASPQSSKKSTPAPVTQQERNN